MLTRLFKKLIVEEDGPTAVEYAIMMALIIVLCITAIQSIGTDAKAIFENAADALD